MRDWGTLLTVAELVSRQWTKGQDDHPGVLWPGLEGVLDMLAAYHGDNASEVAALAMTVVGEWWQPGATGGGVQRADRARAMVWRDWPELAELLGRLVAAEKEVRWEPHFPPLAPQGGVTKRKARTEYVTRDELADKLDEVYQAIRDAVAYGPEYGAAPERPMPERPPIPPEPTGLGAIVRDVDGDHWARTWEGRWLALIPGGGKRTWDDVAMHGPLTVVFEGVES